MEISLTIRRPSSLRIFPDRRKAEELIRRAAVLAGLPERPDFLIAVRLIGDRAMAAANRKFLDHRGPTDVITFSYLNDPASLFPGDTAVELLVSLETAAREGARRKHATFGRELTLYIVHGLLHAAGEDDLSPGPRARMRRRERAVLRSLAAEFSFDAIWGDIAGPA